jgi:fumarate hydratase class II
LIGYSQGAALVKEAMERNLAIKEVALEKAENETLKHRNEDRPVTTFEIKAALSDLRKLTEGGIVGEGGGG